MSLGFKPVEVELRRIYLLLKYTQGAWRQSMPYLDDVLKLQWRTVGIFFERGDQNLLKTLNFSTENFKFFTLA